VGVERIAIHDGAKGTVLSSMKLILFKLLLLDIGHDNICLADSCVVHYSYGTFLNLFPLLTYVITLRTSATSNTDIRVIICD
jgi:hypothetical protein